MKAETKAEFTYQIEEFDKHLNQLLILGNFGSFKNESAISTKTNTRKHIDLSWDDLNKEDEVLTKNIKKLAIKYGYKI